MVEMGIHVSDTVVGFLIRCNMWRLIQTRLKHGCHFFRGKVSFQLMLLKTSVRVAQLGTFEVLSVKVGGSLTFSLS